MECGGRKSGVIPVGILAVADLMLIAAAFAQASSLAPWFAPLHLALTLAALWLSRDKTLRGSGWNCFAVPLGAAIGPCAMVTLYCFKPWSLIERGTQRLPLSTLKPRRRDANHAVRPMVALARMLDERARYPMPHQIESLGTILRHGALGARRKALETVVKSFEPRLSPLIAIALTDADQTMRALAAAAAAQASHNLLRQIADLESAADDNRDDFYALAMLLFDHGCHNELLPAPQRVQLCNRAWECLLACSRQLPTDDRRHHSVSDALELLGAELTVRNPGKLRIPHLRGVETAA